VISAVNLISLLKTLVYLKQKITFGKHFPQMNREEIQSERKKRSAELRNLRLSKGVSQERLIAISGLSWPTITRIESGAKEWRIDSEIMYINALNSLTDKNLTV